MRNEQGAAVPVCPGVVFEVVIVLPGSEVP